MKLVATLARSLQADMQVELRNIESAVTTGSRDAGRGLKTELRRKAAERPNPRQSLRSLVPAGVPRLSGATGGGLAA